MEPPPNRQGVPEGPPPLCATAAAAPLRAVRRRRRLSDHSAAWLLIAARCSAMALDFAAIDWSDPIPGYLPDAKMAGLADVTIRHSGLALPAHSYVLASQCPVLQDMLLSVAELSAGSKRKLSAMEVSGTAGGAGSMCNGSMAREHCGMLAASRHDAASSASCAAGPNY